jgi:hypothetical protein
MLIVLLRHLCKVMLRAWQLHTYYTCLPAAGEVVTCYNWLSSNNSCSGVFPSHLQYPFHHPLCQLHSCKRA